MKILIDSDVCLDSITDRYPFSQDATRLLQLAEDNKVDAILSAESFSNMFYILRKLSSSKDAIVLLKKLRSIVNVGQVTQSVIDEALDSGWNDFEDAIQYNCAVIENCDFIISRNLPDFKQATLPVFTPPDFLKKFK